MRYEQYNEDVNNRYFYAEKIITSLENHEAYPSFDIFRIKHNLKTKNFNENFKLISGLKNQDSRIAGYLQASNKAIYIKRKDKALFFINLAEIEISKKINFKEELSKQDQKFISKLLKLYLSIERLDKFEKLALKIINKNSAIVIDNIIVFKTYLINYSENDSQNYKKIFSSLEKIVWTCPQSPVNKLQPFYSEPNKEFSIRSFFHNGERNKSIGLIKLMEIYSKKNETAKIKIVFKELINIWDRAIKNPENGKSFEIYLPKIVRILLESGLETEAVQTANLIPDIYPFFIKDNNKNSKACLVFYRNRLDKYNKTAPLNRFKAFKNIVFHFESKYGLKHTTQWIKDNIHNEKLEKNLFAALSKRKKDKNKFLMEIIASSAEPERISLNTLKSYYLRILSYYYQTDKRKADVFLNSMLAELPSSDSKNRLGLELEIASKIRKFDDKKSEKIFWEIFNTTTAQKNLNIKNKSQILNKWIHAYTIKNPKDDNYLLAIDKYCNWTMESISSIRVHGNSDRMRELQIDLALDASSAMRRLKDHEKSTKFLDDALFFNGFINNPELKTAYYLFIFSKLSASFEYKKAMDIYPYLKINEDKKDKFITILTGLFIDSHGTFYNYLFFDHDRDGLPSFYNPETNPKHIQNKYKNLDMDSDNDQLQDLVDNNPYLKDFT